MRERREETRSCRPVSARHKGSCGIQYRITEKKKIRVIAYSGYKGEEAPRSFFPGDIKVEVASIIRSWVEESPHDRERRRFFKVRGSDGFIYTLYYDEMKAEWFLANGK